MTIPTSVLIVHPDQRLASLTTKGRAIWNPGPYQQGYYDCGKTKRARSGGCFSDMPRGAASPWPSPAAPRPAGASELRRQLIRALTVMPRSRSSRRAGHRPAHVPTAAGPVPRRPGTTSSAPVVDTFSDVQFAHDGPSGPCWSRTSPRSLLSYACTSAYAQPVVGQARRGELIILAACTAGPSHMCRRRSLADLEAALGDAG